MTHKLEFLNPKWHYGANVTVRRGSKWIEKAFTGQQVDIVKTGSREVLAVGITDTIRLTPFKGVTIQDLWEEHDRECGTPFGLTHAMLRAYPEFTLDDTVAVIRFII